MQNETRKTKIWCSAGFIAIVIMGFLLHYVFEWTNRNAVVGIFVPVNESVWEHLKLGLWGLIIFSAFEYRPIGKQVNNYFLSKGLGIVILSSTILVIFYTYIGIFGRNIVYLDIASFVTGVLFCQILAYRLFNKKPLGRPYEFAGLIFLFLTSLIFAVFTYFPPDEPIFRDKNNSTYGIPTDI